MDSVHDLERDGDDGDEDDDEHDSSLSPCLGRRSSSANDYFEGECRGSSMHRSLRPPVCSHRSIRTADGSSHEDPTTKQTVFSRDDHR